MNRFAIFAVGARPREPMRDLRHAVPGKRTWRGLAIRLDSTNRLYVRGAMANVSGWRVRARHAVPLLKIDGG